MTENEVLNRTGTQNKQEISPFQFLLFPKNQNRWEIFAFQFLFYFLLEFVSLYSQVFHIY